MAASPCAVAFHRCHARWSVWPIDNVGNGACSDVFKVNKLTRCHAPPRFLACRLPCPQASEEADERTGRQGTGATRTTGVTPAPHLPEWRLWPPVPTSKLLRRYGWTGVNETGSNIFSIRAKSTGWPDGFVHAKATQPMHRHPRACPEDLPRLGDYQQNLRGGSRSSDKPEDDGDPAHFPNRGEPWCWAMRQLPSCLTSTQVMR